jgi:co-chaperonin GroES (HSP10)
MRSEEFYSEIAEETPQGLDKFNLEDFRPCLGTILVVLPPEVKESAGGLALPESQYHRPNYGRVVAVPTRDIECGRDSDLPPGEKPAVASFIVDGCPVKPGQWVIFRAHTGDPVEFSGRKDLVLLSYCSDAGSDILGWSDVGPQETEDAGSADREEARTLKEMSDDLRKDLPDPVRFRKEHENHPMAGNDPVAGVDVADPKRKVTVI